MHWLTATLILVVFGLALSREIAESKELRQALLTWHRNIGLTIFALVWLRAALRLRHRAPDHALHKLVRWMATLGHAALYVALLGLPALGYALACSRAGQVAWFGLPLPSLLERDRDVAETFEAWHGTAGWLMLGLIGVHAFMALWHHYRLRDDVLRSMLPARQHPSS